jgi:aryl-alcohol dehydrogenase-like predicted oxidoreductase
MTFGEQLTKEEAHQQLDIATKTYGINFIDTAEIYPIPSSASSFGHTEKIIGEWLKQKGNKREDVIISTKICGFSDEITWCRNNGEGTRITKDQVIEAVDKQLKRLNTDYIDLLHINWPDRYVPLYGAPGYVYNNERESTPIRTQIEVMDALIKSGKVRSFGLSNETPYGVTKFTTIAEMIGANIPCSLQNSYNLLERNEFEMGMQEAISKSNANLGFLAYSPLAGGALSGKYLNVKDIEPEFRMRKYVGYTHRYISAPANEAIKKYKKLADSYDLPLAAIALAYVYHRPFVSSTIIGATSINQLEENVMALNIEISDDLMEAINQIYRSNIDPVRGVFPIIDYSKEYTDYSRLPWGAKDEDMDPELDILISQRFSKF